MKRRVFLKSALALGGTAAIAAPAIAQSAPQIRWRMTSSFPKSVDITFGAGEYFAKLVSDLTDGKFVIQQFAAGEIVPGLQALDAVQSGTVEAAYTGLLFYVGKDPTYSLTSSAPFMMNPRAQNAWYYHGGGMTMTHEFLRKQKVVAYPCGNTGMQWGGWFKKEIKTVDDLRGLKMRIAGLAGNIASRLGVVPQQIAPGDIYPALERGAIDAVEYIGPYDDEKLGFHKVVQRYYSPGWQEGGTIFHGVFNLEKFNELPPLYKKAIEIASQATTLDMLAHYDAKNPEALQRLISQGVQVSLFPNEVLMKIFEETEGFYKGLVGSNPEFATMFNHQREFMKKSNMYQQVADFQYDLMMFRTKRIVSQ
ncbi:alpha-keto acid-binding periplasmic protein TakP precursor [Variibacter gotjawalensis]|uniref:Alpha-keto acid-binding periplasmic protein TakP n=1 Tax=Variibacter gotjawalensis TaxID=1333996 RepID=A0A0S3Q133_9BRAD|nr:TRAP transporter substrate-binding protein DctP [Variibacter gotjawalensis]NIK47745.1 TRAP-type mannitol/chloroaromatic compound transport system substrate-binding protein [Variibacter gotjawalensis]RZS49634.1 TRAP-type mannitol/chloroaromatic compound transport system substrate-binding protein [Variibacter gotjawalensis]BAT61898.1 alpha-keto acid-binding periplasmic protein TakP precursor [Variibacter gotjawalensis]